MVYLKLLWNVQVSFYLLGCSIVNCSSVCLLWNVFVCLSMSRVILLQIYEITFVQYLESNIFTVLHSVMVWTTVQSAVKSQDTFIVNFSKEKFRSHWSRCQYNCSIGRSSPWSVKKCKEVQRNYYLYKLLWCSKSTFREAFFSIIGWLWVMRSFH